jgi:hypothetical protein
MALQSLQKSAFCDAENAAYDWRANFRVMRGNLRLRETTYSLAIDIALSDPEPTLVSVRFAQIKIQSESADYATRAHAVAALLKSGVATAWVALRCITVTLRRP